MATYPGTCSICLAKCMQRQADGLATYFVIYLAICSATALAIWLATCPGTDCSSRGCWANRVAVIETLLWRTWTMDSLNKSLAQEVVFLIRAPRCRTGVRHCSSSIHLTQLLGSLVLDEVLVARK